MTDKERYEWNARCNYSELKNKGIVNTCTDELAAVLVSFEENCFSAQCSDDFSRTIEELEREKEKLTKYLLQFCPDVNLIRETVKGFTL